MTNKDPLLCSLCYSSLEDSPDTEKFTFSKQTLMLCSTCSTQADQISQNTGSNRQAAITYMVELIFAALTSSSSLALPRPSLGTQKANSSRTYPDHT